MPATSFEIEGYYDDEHFSTHSIFESEHMKVVLGYFAPGQFIPVHAPDSDMTIAIRSGTGIVWEGTNEHAVAPDDVVVVEAGTRRGVKADNTRLEALLVTAPPPSDKEHEPVREGLRRGEFIP